MHVLTYDISCALLVAQSSGFCFSYSSILVLFAGLFDVSHILLYSGEPKSEGLYLVGKEHLLFKAKLLGDLQPSPFVSLALQFQKTYNEHKSIANLIRNMGGILCHCLFCAFSFRTWISFVHLHLSLRS